MVRNELQAMCLLQNILENIKPTLKCWRGGEGAIYNFQSKQYTKIARLNGRERILHQSIT